MSFSRMIAWRLCWALPVVFAVVTLTFFGMHLAPGDPALLLAGDSPTPEFLAQVRVAYGLDQPLLQQFVLFLNKVLKGDFGTSIYYNRAVFSVIIDRFPATALLTVTAMILASLLGVALGVAAARRAGTRVDAMITAGSLIGYSMPPFWIGQLLILLFAVSLNWLPAGGMISMRASYSGLSYGLDLGLHMILPVATLSIFLMTIIARFTRAAMVESLDGDYVMVAEAKGASVRRLVWHHAFRNAVVTTVTVIGLEFGAVLAGALVIEVIYSWPGLGRLFYDAIYRRDFPLLTGAFIFSSILVILINLLTDIICALLDPRIGRSGSSA